MMKTNYFQGELADMLARTEALIVVHQSFDVLCREQGYLRDAMMNYLSLLGWNDGTEKEMYTVQELQEAFSIERIIKSPAVFDKAKLSWLNGQHLRALPQAEVRSTHISSAFLL